MCIKLQFKYVWRMANKILTFIGFAFFVVCETAVWLLCEIIRHFFPSFFTLFYYTLEMCQIGSHKRGCCGGTFVAIVLLFHMQFLPCLVK